MSEVSDAQSVSSLESSIQRAAGLLCGNYPLAKPVLASLLLEQDEEALQMVARQEPETLLALEQIRQNLDTETGHTPVEYLSALRYHSKASAIVSEVMRRRVSVTPLQSRLDNFLIHPVTGGLVLALFLYLALYQFVGVFAAGTVVGFLEETVFGRFVNPWVTRLVETYLPWVVLQDLLVGEYGVITLGLRYAAALILPIVTFFFIIFSMVEDSGYLPRLAMLLDRLLKRIGLSGRAVIPLVLGFGCATMATLVTRTLPTKRERVIATLLLSLAVPCSAQLGVILALLSGNPQALSVWALTTFGVFLTVGFFTAKILPGAKPSFYMELPPLRWPQLSNVFVKTYSRVKWYFVEVLPLFLLASVFIWAGRLTRIFDLVLAALSGPMRVLGLPAEAAQAFLFGFFRRDYGAAGLYDLNHHGFLSTRQLIVSSVALTLFLPCIAQFLINVKERGWKTGVSISVFILFFSFSVAFATNFILTRGGMP